MNWKWPNSKALGYNPWYTTIRRVIFFLGSSFVWYFFVVAVLAGSSPNILLGIDQSVTESK